MPNLPSTPEELLTWEWEQFEPYASELAERPVSPDNLSQWLLDWSRLAECIEELDKRLYVATSVNTVDDQASARREHFYDAIYPPAIQAIQKLKQKLLASGLEPPGFAVALRNMRAETSLFRAENLPLLAEEEKLVAQYDNIVGSQSLQWEGQEVTVAQLSPVYQDTDRSRRERAWRLAQGRQLADRQAIGQLWQKFLALRLQIAANAGQPDFRAYRWQQLLRFDYSPDDCKQYHRAIEEVVVPAAWRIYERRRQRLGVDRLRPWDLVVDTLGRSPLHPFQSVEELTSKTAVIFQLVDPGLGDNFNTLLREGWLDAANRNHKAAGAYCMYYPMARHAFIVMNAVGVHEDVAALLHEGGHAMHDFELSSIRYFQLQTLPMEFAEVASTSMELLGSSYLDSTTSGFYSPAEAARARINHLEWLVTFWPYMAVVDAFQHWVYENPAQAMDPATCDSTWDGLWLRFMPGVDWSGLEAERATGWLRKGHIHQDPFYYIEYGMAQLGAVQVWRNALKDHGAAVKAYRRALSLGGSVTLPELYAAAGAKLAFDAAALREAVSLIESKIQELEKV